MKPPIDNTATQLGFRNGLGTREGLFAFNVLVQRCLDFNRNLYVCLIDYNKVRHYLLIHILKTKDINNRNLKIISNLYYHQEAVVSVDNEILDEVDIQRVERQEYVLSP